MQHNVTSAFARIVKPKNRRKELAREQLIVLKNRKKADSIYLDYTFYRENYPDLKGLNDSELREHWRTQAQIEGRFANPEHALEVLQQRVDVPENFCVDEYLFLNEDLRASIKWPFQALHHYLEFGAAEGRRYCTRADAETHNLIKNFDLDFYRAFNDDLENLTDEQCEEHYQYTGINEGRKGNFDEYMASLPVKDVLSEKFNVPSYIQLNSDLVNQFESKWGYLKHYILTGRAEQRSFVALNIDLNFIEEYYGLKFYNNKPNNILFAIRNSLKLDLSDPIFLNEHELVNYHGFKYVDVLDVFDHEAYIYINGKHTNHLADQNRAYCLEHFLIEGYKKGLQISYKDHFDQKFYGCEYSSSLMHLIREEDSNSENVWAIDTVGKRIYEHWVKFGIHEGKFPNLSKFIKSVYKVDLPATVTKEIEVFKTMYDDLITDNRPSQIIRSFAYHGIEEGRFPVSHGVESSAFYCALARSYASQSKNDVAIRIYEDVLNSVPNHPIALHELGDELIKRNFYGKASECYLKLVDSGRGTEWTYLNLAECYKHLSDYNSATKVLRTASKIYPSDIFIKDTLLDITTSQFEIALRNSKHLAKMNKLDEGVQCVVEALENFDSMHVNQQANRDTGRLAIIGNHDLAQCRFYRIDQKIELLTQVGYSTDLYKHTEDLTQFYSRLSQYEAVIFYRVPAIPNVIKAINATNVERIPSIYDVDDLIFDSTFYPPELSTYGGQITEDVHSQLTLDTPLVEHAMRMCEYGIASTKNLAEHMEKYVRSGQVEVLKNGLGSVHLRNMQTSHRNSEKDPINDQSSQAITIFYGSGTKAHKRDFHEIVEPVFLRLHEKFGNDVKFLVLGYFSMTESLSQLGQSLTLLEPESDLESYWDILSSEADINLAVLSSTEVTDTKSEIKWLEASMFGIPSVVSSTATYRDVVEHNETGFICEDSDQFFNTLDSLIVDKSLRARIGTSAKDKVLNTYNIKAQSNELQNILTRFKSNTKTGKLRVAIVNVFYPPEAIGGATRVVHDNVRELIQNYGDHLDIEVFCTAAGREAYAFTEYEQDGIKVTAVTCPAIPNIDQSMSNKDMGLAFAQFLNSFKPDLVHFHCIQRLTETVVSETRRLGIPYVITAHDGWWVSDRQFLINENDKVSLYSYEKDSFLSPNSNNSRSKKLVRELKCAQKILAVSKPFEKIYASTGLDNLTTIENGVSGLSRVERTKSPNGKIRLAHIGGMERHKGLHIIKNVLVSTPELSNFELLVIDHAASFGSIRKELWGSTEVTFKPKTLQSEVSALYSEIDILIAPSVWPESYGLVTREALYCGCWVIASDRGAIGDSIDHGKNGFRVSVDGVQDLRTTLTTINANPRIYLESPQHDLSLRSSVKQAKDLYEVYSNTIANCNKKAA